ncbi:MAG TPA: HepT-like ribonuclease domain-containing protein [Methanospirillum sp.]|nr:HepT-like ribonuclease domain-containing protein [Methanospirillum sp.]HWQ64777.1 HepT-like ribonuclease domain-containing protein [Methanospirillum sp.]
MNGLRNRIIHRYNGTDEVLALAGIEKSLPDIRLLILVIEEWIRKV